MTKFIHNKIQPLINFFFSICFLFSFEGNLFGQKKLNIEKLDDAVGVLIIYDNSNAVLGMGNCFCVDPNGIFYSSYKFFKNCNRAEVRLGNGETYKVNKIISSNESKDLVKFQVKKVGGQELPYLEIEKKEVKKGSDAVAIISPFNPGLMDRHSHGYIYKIYTDDITGLLRFKTNKSLPMVSSGSPLINAYGRVIGITANSRLSGTNDEYVDWAVSINEFDKLKVVNQSKFGEESGKLFNTAFYLTNKIQKNDVSLFIDEAYIGSFEYNNESNSPNCTNPGLLKTKLTEGKHSYYVIENSSGFVWDGEFTVSMNDTCLLFPLSNTPEQVTKKCYLDKYDETGISMSKPIEVENQNNSANNNNANNNANSNNSRNNSNKTNNFGTNDFRKYYRFDGGFEHRNFMAHGGWPTYAFAFEFNRSFDKTPFYASYRISVGVNDSSDFYLHMPAGPLAGAILLLALNSQSDFCSGVTASTLMFLVPGGFGISPLKTEKMELGLYANFLSIDICNTRRKNPNKPNGQFYSPIDYAPDFGVRFNYYFGNQFYFYSRFAAKYSTIFAGWGGLGTIGVGFEFDR